MTNDIIGMRPLQHFFNGIDPRTAKNNQINIVLVRKIIGKHGFNAADNHRGTGICSFILCFFQIDLQLFFGAFGKILIEILIDPK